MATSYAGQVNPKTHMPQVGVAPARDVRLNNSTASALGGIAFGAASDTILYRGAGAPFLNDTVTGTGTDDWDIILAHLDDIAQRADAIGATL